MTCGAEEDDEAEDVAERIAIGGICEAIERAEDGGLVLFIVLEIVLILEETED